MQKFATPAQAGVPGAPLSGSALSARAWNRALINQRAGERTSRIETIGYSTGRTRISAPCTDVQSPSDPAIWLEPRRQIAASTSTRAGLPVGAATPPPASCGTCLSGAPH